MNFSVPRALRDYPRASPGSGWLVADAEISGALLRKIAEKVRQLHRELPQSRILFEQEPDIARVAKLWLIFAKPIDLIEQRRQGCKQLIAQIGRIIRLAHVAVATQRYDVVSTHDASIGNDAGLSVMRRIFTL